MRDVIIIGGGPAGAAAAIALARAGKHVQLLERAGCAVEKVCGEFLAEDAECALRELGLDLGLLGALPIRRAVFAAGWRQAELALPFRAWSLPRAQLDSALLATAASAGAQLRFHARAKQMEACEEGWRLHLAQGDEALVGRAVILATGKHDMPGFPRTRCRGWLGLKLPLEGDAPEAAVCVLACRGGYAGLQPRPGGGANLCAALDPRAAGVAEAARSAEAFFAHVAGGSDLGARLLGALRPAAARPMAVAGIPYGFLHPRAGGPLRVGDQASVIPSVFGDGVAMALRSGVVAAAAVQRGEGGRLHHARWRRRVAGRFWLSCQVARLFRAHPTGLVAALGHAPTLAGWLARATRMGSSRRISWS